MFSNGKCMNIQKFYLKEVLANHKKIIYVGRINFPNSVVA